MGNVLRGEGPGDVNAKAGKIWMDKEGASAPVSSGSTAGEGGNPH